MAVSITRSFRTQWLKSTQTILTATSEWPRCQSTLSTTLLQRTISPTFDDFSPQPSHRLSVTLSDFIPSSQTTALPSLVLPSTNPARVLPIPHHLVYFEPCKRASEMLPDGTNPDHSPGEEWTRRMWAGGRVSYNNDKPFKLDGSRGVMAEFVRDVYSKGREGSAEEKVFVSVERRLAKCSPEEIEQLPKAAEHEQAKTDLIHRVRQRLWRDREEDFGPCSVLERRNLVFMRAHTPEQNQDASGAPVKPAATKILKPTYPPTYQHTIVPTAALLFRFSALTFNAHAIHLDPAYTRDVEGHRARLVHGPLSYVFLTTLLNNHLASEGNEVIKNVEYRNLAPLYCDEPVTFCGARTGDKKWEIWAQGEDGGVKVRGVVVTEEGRVDREDLGM